ncbi:MAG: hypothetical protein KAI73_00170 [Rhodospirillaceae bacterium]|nr:hypothetical protein [Rhodospirillaceae bacterium]
MARLFIHTLAGALVVGLAATASMAAAQSRTNCGPYFQRVIDDAGEVQCRAYSAAARAQIMRSRALRNKQLIQTRALQLNQRSRTVVKGQGTVQLETVQTDLDRAIEMHQKQAEEKLKEDMARREWLFN